MAQVTLRTPGGTQHQATVNGHPSQCPRCHAHLVPKRLADPAQARADATVVEQPYQCTNAECMGLFVAIFEQRTGSGPGSSGFHYTRSIPLTPLEPQLPDTVRALSPVFVETYSQALQADAFGLGQLTGIGLRKALEFLVKDFACLQHPKETEAIKGKLLGQCINEYVSDPQVKQVAKRAAWLGNDETHYVRKWEDRDISDLKTLIRLCINGIDSVLLTQKYINEMPDPAAAAKTDK